MGVEYYDLENWLFVKRVQKTFAVEKNLQKHPELFACRSVGGVSGGSKIESVSMKMSQFLKCHSHCRELRTILLKVKLSQRKTLVTFFLVHPHIK